MLWKDKDGKIYQGGGIVIGNLRYFNPTEDQFLAAGLTKYIPPEPEPDPEYERRRQEYLAACAQFRAVCSQIQQAAELEEFKGGFDEMVEFQQSAVYSTLPGIQLAIAWSAANDLCTYTASKIGLGQPDWWYDCWRQIEEAEEPVEEENGEENSAN